MDSSKQEQKDRITITDVAEALGISKTTVSRAISGKGRIGAETRARVLDYIEKHNYKPSVIAKGLAQSKSYNICWAMPSDYSVGNLPFFQKCLMGIIEMGMLMDYDVLISMISPDDISQLERIVENHKADGVIIGRTLVKDRTTEYLKGKKIPFVAIGSSEDTDVVQIDHDHRGACKELTSIVLSRGAGNVALIGGNKNYVVTQNRYKGFVDAMNEAGKVIDNNKVYFDIDGAVMCERAVDEALKQNVECILCMDDGICCNVINVLKKKKIQVPGDIRVASFYDSDLFKYYQPSITSLKFDPRQLGMVACKTLIDSIEGNKVDACTRLGYELLLRESTK